MPLLHTSCFAVPKHSTIPTCSHACCPVITRPSRMLITYYVAFYLLYWPYQSCPLSSYRRRPQRCLVRRCDRQLAHFSLGSLASSLDVYILVFLPSSRIVCVCLAIVSLPRACCEPLDAITPPASRQGLSSRDSLDCSLSRSSFCSRCQRRVSRVADIVTALSPRSRVLFTCSRVLLICLPLLFACWRLLLFVLRLLSAKSAKHASNYVPQFIRYGGHADESPCRELLAFHSSTIYVQLRSSTTNKNTHLAEASSPRSNCFTFRIAPSRYQSSSQRSHPSFPLAHGQRRYPLVELGRTFHLPNLRTTHFSQL
ncbi:hypothetical protein V2G26_010653 [Clonostachys chloroleuca]